MNSDLQFQFLRDLNWNDGLGAAAEILKSPSCSLEAAVLAFWRLEGPWFYPTNLRDDEQCRLIELVARRVLGNELSSQGIAYDPVEDNQLSKVQVRKLVEAGLPTIFLGPFGNLQAS